MREILFRGKRTDTGEWIEGYFEKYNGCSYINLQTERLNSGGYPIREFVEVIPETVGQFTGLTDKNGKRIFEGDIGFFKQTDGAKRNGKRIICTGKVVYWNKTASYAVESKDEAGVKYFDYFPINDFEIIGNVHDNPELLNIEKEGE